jgi:hypothetical protein
VPADGSPASERLGAEIDHGPFVTVLVRGVNAQAQVEAYRRAFERGSGRYPFLIGDAGDLAALKESLRPPADGGAATLAAARALDVAGWLHPRCAARPPRWPADDPAGSAQADEGGGDVRACGHSALIDPSSGGLKPLVHIGLVEVAEPYELFARLGYGGWNGCPAPELHVALHRHWQQRFGADPVAVGEAIVACTVARPPESREAALALAAEHQAYGADLAEEGAGGVAALAVALRGAPVWQFRWH